MSAVAVPLTFNPRQTWRVVSGYVPGCPVGTVVTLSTRGPIFDVTRPWAGLAASVDMRTTNVFVSPDSRSCMIRSTEGEAVFTIHDGSLVSAPLAPAPSIVPLPPEIARPGPLRYLEGTWQSAGYRSGRTRALWAQGFFVVMALIQAWYLVQVIKGLGLASRAVGGTIPTPSEADDLSGSIHTLSGILGLGIILLAIAFFAWISRTVDNVPPLAGGTPRDSPRWSVGWWFVPIAFFWKPYSVVREAWDRLSVPARPPGSLWVQAWWLAGLGGFLVDKVSAGVASSSNAWSNLLAAQWIDFAAVTLYLSSAIFGFVVVHEIQARADLRARALGLDGRPASLPFAPAAVASGMAAVADGTPVLAGPASAAPADALRSLGELKEQGLVSDEEYAAKRVEILSRL